MLTKAVVAGVLLLAAAAAADTVRNAADGRDLPEARRPEGRVTRWRIDRGPTPCRTLVPGACGRYLVLGGVVVRDGRPFLSGAALSAAFPGPRVSPVVAFRVANGPGGALAVAVLDGARRGAVEIWRDGSLLGAFRVPARSFAAGLGWSPRGDLVATYPRRGRPTLYDHDGTRVAEARWERRPG